MKMNKDERAWTAMEVPKTELERDGFISYAVKHLIEKLAKGLLDTLSDGKEYAVKMMSVQELDHVERGTAEIRTAINMREIVRCGNCEHHYTADCPLHFEYDPLDDWFCADGKRKEQSDALDS